jgi:hypothetical protein
MNGDGWPDIVVTNLGSNTIGMLLGNRYHTFQPQVTYATAGEPNGIVIADFNGDGRPDIAVTSISSNSVRVFLNNTPSADRIFANGFE